MCQESTELATYALKPEERKNEVGESFYEHPESKRDGLNTRSYYHRDRDRIIWSTAFRRLQNKTQVFGHDDEDHFRRRLTHSIEVSALACSIARSLQLNEVATDAIALGHDIGHTPFGHAGEEALNSILAKYLLPPQFKDKEPIPLVGFDHCAHAIEVISRIETNGTTTPGLNLTYDIRDGILKHIYFKGDEADAPKPNQEKPYSTLKSIVKCEKYKQYKDNYGSLEAQCVWFADKLVYLFSDLEDAIRAKVFPFDITRSCEIIKAANSSNLRSVLKGKFKKNFDMEDLKNKSLEIKKDHIADEVRQYLFWRNKTIRVMINDCVEETGIRIKHAGINSVSDVFKHPKRLVDVSDEVKVAWRDQKGFYSKVMIDHLFSHPSVLTNKFNSFQKIRKLFEIYKNDVGYKLIPKDYKKMTKKNYAFLSNIKLSHKKDGTKKDGTKVDAMKIVTIRNYIAGMSDAFANQMLQRYDN